MITRLIFSIILIGIQTNNVSAALIKGILKGYPETYVTIYKYTDYIIKNTAQIAQVKTDKNGNFIIKDLNYQGIVRLKITVDKQSVSFYCTNENAYVLKENDRKLLIAENVNDLNSAIRSIDKDFHALRYLWLDSATGKAVNKISPVELLKRIDSIKFHYFSSNGIADKEYNTRIDYYCAYTRMFFITLNYSVTDSTGAIKAFNEMEHNYFIRAKFSPDDNLYINLLGLYLYSRINLQNFERVEHGDKYPVENNLAEADYFANDSLKELSKLLIIKMVYENKWYKGEMTVDQYNRLVDSIGKNFRIPIFRDYIKQVILANNKTKTGDPFPIVSLPDINNQTTDITKIAEPFILIDFWATWCHPCTDEMTKFPALMKKYKGKLMIVSLSVDGEFTTMKTYLEGKHYAGLWEMWYNGQQGNYLDKLKIDHYPTFYLLDKEKHIISNPDISELPDVLEKLIR